MKIDFNQFFELGEIVIDKLEGGYYHPDMLKDGRIKDTRYSNSGETMFGIDRLRGGNINYSEAGIKFWNLIDSANARKNWAWNYKGGNLSKQLKELACQMLYPQFTYNFNKFLSKEAQDIVANDKRLLFHFVYATWNGAGWFKKFAQDINEAVNSGIKNDELVKVALNSRINEGLIKGSKPNSLIQQGGKKIATFIWNLNNDEKSKKTTKIIFYAIITIITIIIILYIYLIYLRRN